MSSDIHNALAALKVFEQQYRGLLELAPVLKTVADVKKLQKDAEFNKAQSEAQLKTMKDQIAAAQKRLNNQRSAAAAEAAKAAEALKAANADVAKAQERAAAVKLAVEDEVRRAKSANESVMQAAGEAAKVGLLDVEAKIVKANEMLVAKNKEVGAAEARLAEVNLEVDRLKKLFIKN